MQGDPLVDRLMMPVVAALMRHGIKGDAKTDIYNRAYEAVMNSMVVMDTMREQLSEANRRANGLDEIVQMYGNMIATKDSIINNQEHFLRWRKLKDEPPPIYVFVETVDFAGDIQGDYFSTENKFLSRNGIIYWRHFEYPNDFNSDGE